MKTILQCYEKHGPRQIRIVKGIPVADHRIQSLLAELESISWPKTTRERRKYRFGGAFFLHLEYDSLHLLLSSYSQDTSRVLHDIAKAWEW